MQIHSDSLFAQYANGLERSERKPMAGLELDSEESDASEATPNFSDLLMGGVAKVNEMQTTANDQVAKLLTGQDVNSAEVLTSMQKADMAFRLLVQVRNKLMKAYDDINQIRI